MVLPAARQVLAQQSRALNNRSLMSNAQVQGTGTPSLLSRVLSTSGGSSVPQWQRGWSPGIASAHTVWWCQRVDSQSGGCMHVHEAVCVVTVGVCVHASMVIGVGL